jgi:hypothetical protein
MTNQQLLQNRKLLELPAFHLIPYSYWVYALKGLRNKAQGWPRFLRPILGTETIRNLP